MQGFRVVRGTGVHMSRPVAIISTVAAGGLIALQPPANAALAEHVGDLGAALVSTAISVLVIGLLLVIVGDPSRLSGLSAFKPEYVIGGLGGATVVAVSLVTVRPLGAGAVVAVLVAAQLLVSLAADRFGWLGLHEVGLSAGRLTGLALVIGGTVLITRG
jgi:bacterial/archaeal transporter family-2 protein